MYQSLIWAAVLRDDACGLATALDSKDMERAPDALIDSVRGDVELGRDLFRRPVLVDEEQTVELTSAEPRDTRSQFLPRRA
jgi:hypothetical protein